jgi:stearoyl-CoA desaturase (Delta-9 desaturase)
VKELQPTSTGQKRARCLLRAVPTTPASIVQWPNSMTGSQPEAAPIESPGAGVTYWQRQHRSLRSFRIASMNKLFFISIHLVALSAFWIGTSRTAIVVCAVMYLVRMFAITGGYHRYFSHRTFRTTRIVQFILAFLGASAAQKGPLWWAASHRHHHKHSDQEGDLHSPGRRGIWWAHAGWVLSEEADDADTSLVRDLQVYPELRLLERYHYLPPLCLVVACYGLGLLLVGAPFYFNTSPLEIVVWGAFVSTVFLYHAVFAINSLAHLLGSQRFDTGDDSRNSFLLSLVTLGEGWHNNHHRYPGSERQGFYWWEIDITHYILVGLSYTGLVWDLRVPPARIFDEAAVRRRKSVDTPQHVAEDDRNVPDPLSVPPVGTLD